MRKTQLSVVTVNVSLALLAILFPLTISAQSQAELEEFEQWKKQFMGEFRDYKDQIDREFAEFLNQKWEPFDTEKGIVRDEAPKPGKIPVAKVKPVVKLPVPPGKVSPKPVIKVPPVKIVKPQPVFIPLPPPVDFNDRIVTIDYLGHKLSIVDGLYDSYSGFDNQVSKNSIQHNFSELAKSDYARTVDSLLGYKRQLDMNDWAYLQLILKFSEKLALNRNSQRLVSWFLLLKSGLKARLAYDSNNIYLLVAARQNLYDIAYFKFDGEKFYSIPKTKKLPSELFSYNGKYPKALTQPDFSISKALKSKNDAQNRKLSFKYQGKKYQFSIPVNKNTVNFFASYPQMDIGEYFQTQLDDQTAQALLIQLKPVVEGMTETDAVNFLLAFVQHAFRYQTDNQQFGEENYMFIEETLYYPSSDCEDRAIIFSWLVRHLLGLEVIGLEFPGHVAAAVKLKQPAGDVVNYNNQKFIVTDPTYINARAGMKMPQYRNTQPKVIIQ
jgi:hypothetical protein